MEMLAYPTAGAIPLKSLCLFPACFCSLVRLSDTVDYVVTVQTGEVSIAALPTVCTLIAIRSDEAAIIGWFWRIRSGGLV